MGAALGKRGCFFWKTQEDGSAVKEYSSEGTGPAGGSRLGCAAENISHQTPWRGALYDPYNSHFPAKDVMEKCCLGALLQPSLCL